MATTKLIIDGVKLEAQKEAPKASDLQFLASYQITGNTRGATEKHSIDTEGRIFEFIFEDETTWLCEHEKLDDLFPQKNEGERSIDKDFSIPDGLTDASNANRGLFQTIALKIINVFVKKVVETKVLELAQKFEEKQLNTAPGLYKLDQNFQLKDVDFDGKSGSYFLFIHGTFSSTAGSFGSFQNTELWKQLNLFFPERLLALQHETLSKSPLENVIDLLKKLPNEITLNIISHSRGGLVGDIISKYAKGAGYEDLHIKLLENYESNRSRDIAAIKQLGELFKSRKIIVERFIRVCSPSSGTILASNRLSNMLNITLNLIGITNPIFSFLKDLLVEVIKSKDNADVLPGLEAMNPESPFIKILNDQRPGVEIDDNLIVLSASARAKINLKGLLIIVTRLFYNQRNDLVVNTDSMYLGAKRKKEIQYYFEEDTDIDHISIFDKVETQNRIITILKTNVDQKIPEFKAFLQTEIPSTDRNINVNKLLPNGSLRNDKVSGQKPILILLPGIMGSTLYNNDNSLWINYWRFLEGGLIDLNIENDKIAPNGIVKSAYNNIYEKLSETYDVVTLYYDWRKNLEDISDELKNKIEALLKENQPIKVLAHSMGGVLFRDFVIKHDETWQKLNKSAGFKAVYLGTPFRGSMRIASVFMGQDGVINKLAKIDLFHTKNNLLSVFNKFPGIYCLLPLTKSPSAYDFSKQALWKEMQDKSLDPKPPIPSEAELLTFEKYRDKVLDNIDKIDYSNMAYVAGKGNSTVSDYYYFSTGTKSELKFIYTAEGDESVTWETGIPAQLKNLNAVYYAQCVHGELANDPKIFDAIAELLANGSTTKLDKNPSNLRSKSSVTDAGNNVSFDITERGVEATLLGLGNVMDDDTDEKNITVVISNGDLKYANYPIISGHFKNDGILNGEKAIDNYLKGMLGIRNELNLYPEDIGTNELFISDCETDNSNFEFKGAIIVGLGKIGDLSRSTLIQTIESAALRYLLDLNSKNSGSVPLQVGISSLLVGCGYGGLSIEASSSSIIKGIHKANMKIKSYFPNNTIQINEIEFIERYEDKAISSFYVLSKAAFDLRIIFATKKINILPGAKKRIVVENTDEWWNRISVLIKPRELLIEPPQMTFSLSARRASEDKRDVSSGTEMLNKLIASFSKEKKWNENIAHTIFELMIPNDFKENLKNKGSIAWILDKETAKYPWELLKDQNDSLPLSVNAGMVRQLSSENTRKTINYILAGKALVIADPILDGFVQQLPGALKEGNLASSIFEKNGLECKKLVNSNSLDILTAIFPNKYKIIHLAGHGEFNAESPMNSGMIIGNQQYLTTAQLTQMSNVPEFVFVNCCYLGSMENEAEAKFQNRYKFAANIGTELIDIGVKAVIAAGWEVNDTRALKFAEVFYNAMFDGYNFGESVLKARKEIYTNMDNTWGAYQCYGDPFYKFDINQSQSKKELTYTLAEEAEYDLINLKNNLDTGGYSYDATLQHMNNIADAIKKAKIRNNIITELEAQIYAEMGDYDLSNAKYEALLNVENADFSLKSIEKYNNILTKKCVIDFEKGSVKNSDLLILLDKAIKNIEALIAFGPTAERYSYLGSAYKRKGYITEDGNVKLACYLSASENYKLADSIKEDSYPFSNWAVLDLLLTNKLDKKIANKNKAYLEKLDHKNSNYNNFWSLVKKNNLMMVDLLQKPTIDPKDIITDYNRIWNFIGTKGKKIAELEQLKILIDVAKLKEDNTRLTKLKEILEQLGDLV